MITNEKVIETINNALNLNLDLETTPLDASFKSLGIDSLDVFTILVELEALTGCDAPYEDVDKLSTIRSLTDYFS